MSCGMAIKIIKIIVNNVTILEQNKLVDAFRHPHHALVACYGICLRYIGVHNDDFKLYIRVVYLYEFHLERTTFFSCAIALLQRFYRINIVPTYCNIYQYDFVWYLFTLDCLAHICNAVIRGVYYVKAFDLYI